MRSFVRFAAIGLAASSFVLAAQASAQTYAPDRLMRGVKVEDLKAIVASFDHELIQEGVTEDASVAARDEFGTIYILMGTACDDAAVGCQGVNMQVRFNATDVDVAAVNEANMMEQAANTWFDAEDEALGVTRYVVLDYGITMANLRENVNVLLAIAENVRGYFE